MCSNTLQGMDQPTSLAERRSRLSAAVDALQGLDGVLHEASGAELAELMVLTDRVAAKAGAARVSVAVEATARGEVAQAGTNVHTWVRDHAPSLRQGGAGAVAEVVDAVIRCGAHGRPGGGEVDPESPVGIVWAAVRDGGVSPALATTALREMTRLEPLLRAAAKPTVTRSLLELGTAWGPTMMRRLRPRLLAEYGRAGVLDDLQERLTPAARLSAPRVESGDLTEYQLLMTPDQATALEAAIGPLSAPAPNEETGERDLRPAGQRRVEALTEVCRRSSAVDADGSGHDGAGAAAAAVYVTVSLEDLQARTGCAEVVGSCASGTLLSPEAVRRISCDADLIPAVLGSAGEDVDMGRVVRLFTRAQRRRLWRRDRGCTYPGCSAPPSWSKAHHVLHWVDGGRSDLDNAALLCQRHHTAVHRRRLVAEVRGRPDERGRHVEWDLADGSYDRHLERLRAERAQHDPPRLTPQRVRRLLSAVPSADEERRWVEHQLAQWWSDEESAADAWAADACAADACAADAGAADAWAEEGLVPGLGRSA
jgi:hypothetical protein